MLFIPGDEVLARPFTPGSAEVIEQLPGMSAGLRQPCAARSQATSVGLCGACHDGCRDGAGGQLGAAGESGGGDGGCLGGAVAWGVVVAGVAVWSVGHSPATVPEQRTIGQAMPELQQAAGVVYAAASGPGRAVVLGGLQVATGCRVTPVRHGDLGQPGRDRLCAGGGAERGHPGDRGGAAGPLSGPGDAPAGAGHGSSCTPTRGTSSGSTWTPTLGGCRRCTAAGCRTGWPAGQRACGAVGPVAAGRCRERSRALGAGRARAADPGGTASGWAGSLGRRVLGPTGRRAGECGPPLGRGGAPLSGPGCVSVSGGRDGRDLHGRRGGGAEGLGAPSRRGSRRGRPWCGPTPIGGPIAPETTPVVVIADGREPAGQRVQLLLRMLPGSTSGTAGARAFGSGLPARTPGRVADASFP